MWLLVVAEAGVMEMTVDVGACCGGVVVARVWFWRWRCAHRLPRIAFKHHPCLNAHMQPRMRSKITATATDAPTSR